MVGKVDIPARLAVGMKRYLLCLLTLVLLIGSALPFALPVYADSLTVYSSASDGYIYAMNATYNTVWTAASGTKDSTGTPFDVGQDRAGPFENWYYDIYRAFVYFDTSSIPSDATVTSATLYLYGAVDYTTQDFLLTVQNGQPTYPTDPMANADYNKSYYSGDGGSFNTSGFVVGNYNTLTLNSIGRGWIQKGAGAKTKLCLRSDREIAGTTPITYEFISISSADASGTSQDPYLYVEYSTTVAPTVTTQSASAITTTTATGNGNITSKGLPATISDKGICYSPTTNPPTTGDSIVHAAPQDISGAYTESLIGLTAATKYYDRAYAINPTGTGYGSVDTFLTLPAAPTGLTPTAGNEKVDFTWTNAAGGSGTTISTMVRYRTDTYPTSYLNGTLGIDWTTGTSGSATSLTNGTPYYFSAFTRAVNSGLTQYSTAYVTADGTPGGFPTVVTNAADNVTCTNATLDGDITATGGENADYRGFVWASSTKSAPGNVVPPGAYSDNWTASGSFGISNFTHDITLAEGQTRYYRAFAHNSSGWVYGSEVDFTTLADPVITSDNATDITVSSAKLLAYLSDDGGEACEVRWGWGLTDNGTNIDNYDFQSAFAGSYTTGQSPFYNTDNLTMGATYYFNVEVQNSCGTDTGASRSFTVESNVGSPSNVTVIPNVTSNILSWTKGTSAPNTFIRCRTNACPVDETDGTLVYLGTASTYTHTGLTSGVDYCYYFVGYDAVAGYSVNSTIIHATTLAAGIILDTTGTATSRPSGMTQAPSASAHLEASVPIFPYIRKASTSTGIPIGSLSYILYLIVLIGLSYGVYRWTHSIEWIVAIWVVASWVAYPTLHIPIIAAIFVTIVGLGYGIYRIRSVI
jgi:hypothetical protein